MREVGSRRRFETTRPAAHQRGARNPARPRRREPDRDRPRGDREAIGIAHDGELDTHALEAARRDARPDPHAEDGASLARTRTFVQICQERRVREQAPMRPRAGQQARAARGVCRSPGLCGLDRDHLVATRRRPRGRTRRSAGAEHGREEIAERQSILVGAHAHRNAAAHVEPRLGSRDVTR